MRGWYVVQQSHVARVEREREIDALRDALQEAIPYVNGVALDSANPPWRREMAEGVLGRIRAALAFEAQR